MKKVWYALLGIFTLLLVLLIVFLAYLDDIIKGQLENTIPPVTQTHFEVGDITASPFKGKIEIKNLLLGNPEGFPDKHSIKLDRVLVQVDLGSLLQEKVIIKSLIIDGLDVYFVNGGAKGSNLEVILRNIEKHVKEEKLSEENEDKPRQKSIKNLEDIKIQVNLFEMNNGRVLVQAKQGLPLNIKAEFQNVKVENMGSASNGITLDTFIEEVMKKIIKEVNIAVSIGKKAKNEVNEGLSPSEDKENKNIKEVLKELFQKH